jgi:hypothetical protein
MTDRHAAAADLSDAALARRVAETAGEILMTLRASGLFAGSPSRWSTIASAACSGVMSIVLTRISGSSGAS